jgi:hypothetical protein
VDSSYENQLFVSYAREQRKIVEGFVSDLRAAGLTVWWDKDIPVGDRWSENLKKAIKGSRHFLLYWTVYAGSSQRVSKEIKTFREDAKRDTSRKLFVLRAPESDERTIRADLGKVQHASHINEVIIHLLKEARNSLDQKFRDLENKAEKERQRLEEDLAKERLKVADARKYYRHSRFWGPFAENRDVHIFTCGRDIPPDDTRPRGTGGVRTNIDKWDYRAVLGIAHYFASTYPGTRLTIEDPASKLQQEDIDKTYVLADRIAESR